VNEKIIIEIETINRHILDLIGKIEDPIVQSETKRLVSTGGKRLRPLFLLWSARASGRVTDEIYHAAAALELLHTSSLIHDDIIDQSDLRRGAETTSKLYGKERATSIGTVLSLFAIEQIADLENDDISKTLAETLEFLCLGEIKQLRERFDFNCSCKDYIEKISHKTASLFALPCKIGGILSEAEETDTEKLTQIGFNIGCSFQILDDIIDIDSSQKVSGKDQYQDLKSGVITLPYLLLMESDEAFRERINRLTPESAPEEFHSITMAASSESILEDTFSISNHFLDEALYILSTINSIATREEFTYLINKFYKNIQEDRVITPKF